MTAAHALADQLEDMTLAQLETELHSLRDLRPRLSTQAFTTLQRAAVEVAGRRLCKVERVRQVLHAA